MPCPTVTTGSEFLTKTLSHLDCQAQLIGSFGFQSLAQPGSPAAIVLTTLLTLFIAVYGVRLLFGPVDEPRDLINAGLKVGIVLTIALSWPAWRIIAYETVLHGPAEIAAVILPDDVRNPRISLPQQLQGLDTGMAALTAAGTGRQNGKIINEGRVNGFRPVALDDDAGFGWSRTIYLASTIGSLAALRIAAGLLLALAPLFAGLLLFEPTRGLFMGWFRGLALVALGSLGLTVLLTTQVAIMTPWLSDILNRRTLGYATPTAPTELLALVAGFGIATAILLSLLGRVAFQTASRAGRALITRINDPLLERSSSAVMDRNAGLMPAPSRAEAIGQFVAVSVRRETAQTGSNDRILTIGKDQGRDLQPAGGPIQSRLFEPLGSSGYKRTSRREAGSQRQRDQRS